jgi:hypothetical protein
METTIFGRKGASCGPNTFVGWMRRLSVQGIAAVALRIRWKLAARVLGGNAYRSERTHRDVGLRRGSVLRHISGDANDSDALHCFQETNCSIYI